jgi:hypothetical protein
MRSRRTTDVFVIGEERILDEDELGLTDANGPGEGSDAAGEADADAAEFAAADQGEPSVEDEEPIRVVEGPPRRTLARPTAVGRWARRGVVMASVLVMVVLIGSALRGGGERDSRGPVVARTPPTAKHEPKRERPDEASRRDPPQQAERSRSAEPKPEPAKPAPKPSPDPEREAPGAEPPSTVAPAPADGPATASAPAPASPATAPPPPLPDSSSSGAPAVASAAEVRQEFGP